MILLDAGVIIGHLDADDAHHQNAVTLMSALADQPSSTSPITVAETAGGRVATHDDRLATVAHDRGLAAPTP